VTDQPASGEPFAVITGADDVNISAVRHLLEAIEWDCPPVEGPDGLQSVAVPLSTYLTFAMPSYREPGKPIPPATLPPFPYHRMATRGTRAMAISVEVEAGVPMRFGDRLTSSWYLANVREGRTRLGPSAFLSFETHFRNQREQLVATERTVVLNFTPEDGSGAAAPPAAPWPEIDHGSATFDPAVPRVGQVLPALRLPLTLQRLAMIAGANRDYSPIHHDPAAAAEIGARAPIANSMVLLSFIERLITDNGGLGTRVLQFGPLRLLRPTAATGILGCGGQVTRVHDCEGGFEVWVDAWIGVEPDGMTAAGPARFFVRRRS
jgi:acyl dehydratase